MLKPFFVYHKKVLRSISPEDVVCLVAAKKYTKIWLANEEFCLVRSSLTGVLEKLPPEMFIKIHRAHVVSLYFINNIARDHVTIGQKPFPIGRQYYKKLIEQLNIIE
jgi:DNA-binding LytR/AlgR family response regulator